MTDREFLETRCQTLRSLSNGAATLNGGGASLQHALQQSWDAELRLLTRILGEPGDVAQTLAAWQTRTASFIEKYPERDGWTDAGGHAWNAQQVSALLADVQARLEAFHAADEVLDDAADEDES